MSPRIIFSISLLLSVLALQAAPGDLDTSFGTGGKVTTAIGSSVDSGRSVAVQSDGKILVAGYSSIGGNNDIALVRYTSTGALDTSFNGTGKVTTAIGSDGDVGWSVAVQDDGKILVAGYSHNGGGSDIALVRYTSTGALDTSFNGSGKVTTNLNVEDYGHSVAVQSDGKILVAGYSGIFPNYDFTLVRYTSTGTLDTSFNGTGMVTTPIGSSEDQGYSVAVQGDGKILVAGYSHNGSNADMALVRYMSTGALDTSFNGTGKVTTAIGSSDDYGLSVTVQGDGRILVTGHSHNGSGADVALVRYTSAGLLDTGFNGTGKVTTAVGSGGFSSGRGVAVQSDGKIVVAGAAHNGSNDDFALVRYTSTGALDSTFNGTGKLTTAIGSGGDAGTGVVVQGNGKIVVAGSAWIGGNDDFALVRYEDRWLSGYTPAQLAYLKASNPAGTDDFGRGVAIDGDTVVIGAPNEDSTAAGGQANNGATDAGAVYVFVRDGTGWSQQAYLKASNAEAGDLFGTNVAIDGDTLIVSAREEDSGSNTVNSGTADNSALEAGAAYIFVRSGTTWTQQAYLKASDSAAGDQFGWSVAISGDTAVVGARYEDGTAADSGAVYVFTRSGSTWTQQQRLKASNAGASDHFGVSVDIDGDTLISGAFQEDGTATDAGAAYIFTRSGTTWTQQQILRAAGGGADDGFGGEVAISGESVVIRASSEDGSATTVNGTVNNSATDAGAAYVFTRSGTTWSQQAYLKPTNAEAGDQFGRSVDIDGDIVAVGAPSEDSASTGIDGNAADNSAASAGAAYIFTRVGTTWMQTAYLKASNTGAGDNLGITGTVRLSGTRVIAGAPLEDGGAAGVDGNEVLETLTDSGAAYLFDLDAPPDLRVEYPAGISLADGQSSVSFPATMQAVPLTRVVRVKNAGGKPLTVTATATTAGFDVTGVTLPLTLAAGAYQDITVRFLANLPSGAVTGSLTLISNDPDDEATFDIGLSGTASFGNEAGLDFAFGAGGTVPAGVATALNGTANHLAIQPDGKVVAVGSSSGAFKIVRCHSNGALDGSFGSGGMVSIQIGDNSSANAVALQTDGKIVVVGFAQFWDEVNFEYQNDFALVRCQADGTLDTTFDTDGIVTTDIDGYNDIAHDVAIQSNGRIVVTGSAYFFNTFGADSTNFATVRYTVNGSLDTSFGDGDGWVATDFVDETDVAKAIAIQSDGKIVVAGYSYNAGRAEFALARYTTAGLHDTTFSSDGAASTTLGTGSAFADDLVIQPDGKLVLAGRALNGSYYDTALARFTTAGALDAGFGIGGRAITAASALHEYAEGVTLLPDGRIVTAGYATNGGATDVTLVRFSSLGVPDISFGSGGVVFSNLASNDSGRAVAFQPDGRLLVAGQYGSQFAVFRFGADIKPAAFTEAAQAIGMNSAVAHGVVNPNGIVCNAWIEWGPTSGYGNITAIQPLGYGTSNLPVSAVLTGLSPGTTYHFRVVAQNGSSSTTGSNQTFTTLTEQQTWRQTYFGTTGNSGNAADTFDFDKDGLLNLIEWACHLNPSTSSTLPVTTMHNGANLEFTYVRSVSAVTAGTVFMVEWSDTMASGSWSTSGVAEQVLSDNGIVQQVKATLPAGSGGRRFVRLRVTAP